MPFANSWRRRRNRSGAGRLGLGENMSSEVSACPPAVSLLRTGSLSMDRRECLTAATAVAAGSALLAETVGQDKNPAAQVADRTSTLKITALRTYWVNPVVFVKIETNHGATGWGEIKAVDPRVAQVLAQS